MRPLRMCFGAPAFSAHTYQVVLNKCPDHATGILWHPFVRSLPRRHEADTVKVVRLASLGVVLCRYPPLCIFPCSGNTLDDANRSSED